ncbi:MAG: hypothetical protein GJ678_10815 [Rhodobacteraceae bacterium]|jgi:hypothetical protein|nr:hypothetical protein [Paracoccaceae bacterium]
MSLPSKSWLYDVVVFNESEEYALPGDVSIHRSIEEMCSGMEAWMVEGGGIGFCLNGLGQVIKLEMDGDQAVGSVVEEAKPDLDTLTIWLRHVAKDVQQTRLAKSNKKLWFIWSPTTLGKVEAEGALPETIEGLLAYIHI